MSLHWTEEEFARYMGGPWVHRPHAQPVTEKAFLGALITMARREGFLAFHTYRSTKSAEGFPDLILDPAPRSSRRASAVRHRM